MLHGSETWPVRKENEVALQLADMRMVSWMCIVKAKDRVPSKELRERLGLDDIILILQQNRLRWYGHVLLKEDTDWVQKCQFHSSQALQAVMFWLKLSVKQTDMGRPCTASTPAATLMISHYQLLPGLPSFQMLRQHTSTGGF